jgi:hypothetical protein
MVVVIGEAPWAKICQNNRTRPSHVHFVHPNVTRKARDVPHTRSATPQEPQVQNGLGDMDGSISRITYWPTI